MQTNQFNLAKQANIIEFLHVKAVIDAEKEAISRINFIKHQLHLSQCKALVLGISGGIDSTVAGRLAQIAVEQLRETQHNVRFIAMRLPYGIQKDECDAQKAIAFIQPDELVTVNIKVASDASLKALMENPINVRDEAQLDFILGNIKARQRMVSQYAMAGFANALVIGTDHAAEALMGFFTKHGDGACDLAPLTGLNKRQVKAVGTYLQVPDDLVNKFPTADLENLFPLRPDEEAFGLSYQEIDDFLEGKIMPETSCQKIFKVFDATAHKRALPITPYD